jgi:hypothetical protein
LRRRLWLLDLALIALIALAATALRQRWLEGRAREETLLKQIVPAAPAPPLPPLPGVQPSQAAEYLSVAQQMVFSRDRSPTVILDPPPAPPPPKPMPPLPVAYGVLNLGEGPLIILSEKSGAQHRGYKAGEKIGEFKVHAFNNREIVLEWEGKYVKKTIEELSDRRVVAQAQPPSEAAEQAAPAPAPQPPKQQPQSVSLSNVRPGPGQDMGNSNKECVPGDSSPSGTVVDGMRKVVRKTPFGESCYWEPAK